MKRFRAAVSSLLLAMAAPSVAPAAPPAITLYSSLSYGAAVASAFTRATGIPMRVVSARQNDVLAHTAAQGRHPRWSIAWFDGAAPAAALDEAGLLAHGLPRPPGLTERGKALMPASGAWVPTGLTLANILAVAADPYVTPPGDWFALTGGAYHGIVGMADPALESPAYDALAGLLQDGGGWPQGVRFLSRLKWDGLHVYASDANALAALRSGSIGLAIMNSAPAFADAEQRGSPLRLIFPKQVYLMPSVIVMARDLDGAQQNEASRFIAFVNSPETQDLRLRTGADGWYWPVTQHPAPHAGLPPLAALDPKTLNPREWGPLMPTVLRWFNKVILGD